MTGAQHAPERGRYIASRKPSGPFAPGDLAVDATLRAWALRRAEAPQSGPAGRPAVQDLRQKLRRAGSGSLVVFVVDSSDSMGSSRRISLARAAVTALLRKSYLNRDHVALIAAGGDSARILLQPTSSVRLAEQALAGLESGGATPIGDGLLTGLRVCLSHHFKAPGRQAVVALFSDGETNVPLQPGGDCFLELRSIGREFSMKNIPIMAFEADLHQGGLRQLAETVGGVYHAAKPGELADSVRFVLSKLGGGAA